MSERKRINISVDPDTYAALSSIKRNYGFKNLCEMIVAFVNILVDRRQEEKKRLFDLPDADGAYIDSMFDELASHERTPDGSVPVRHLTKGNPFNE